MFTQTTHRFLIGAVVGLTLGCSSTKPEAESRPPVSPAGAATTQTPKPTEAATAAAISTIVDNFRRVHFEFDSATLSPATREVLLANTELMRAHPDVTVEIQGHCDDRGTTEYNLSLGERRAKAIRDYMAKAGVEQARLAIISFGKERPIARGTDETAWSKNRRAEFRVLVDRTAVATIRGSTDE